MGFRESSFAEQSAFYLAVGEGFVAVNNDAPYLHLLLFVYYDIKYHLILVCHIRTLDDVYLSVLEAFLVEVTLCDELGTVKGVRRHLKSLEQSELLFHVGTLRLLDADIVHLRHPGVGTQPDVKVRLVGDKRVDNNRNIREKPVIPVFLDSLGEFVARQGDSLSD